MAQSFPVFIVETCGKPGLQNLASCEATKYLGTGFATIQSIADLAFIQVLLDFQRLNLLFSNCKSCSDWYPKIWLIEIKITPLVAIT